MHYNCIFTRETMASLLMIFKYFDSRFIDHVYKEGLEIYNYLIPYAVTDISCAVVITLSD